MTLDPIWKATLLLSVAGLAAALLQRSSAARRHLVWVAAFGVLAILPLLPAVWTVNPGHALFTMAQAVSAAGDAGMAAVPRTPWVTWLWLAGVAILLCRLAVAHLRLARIARSANSPVAHAGVPAAMVWGFRNPVILLPVGDPDPRDLAHEMAHVSRRDTWWQLLTQLVCALYWFHPLVWLAARKAAEERERACDDLVLASGIAPADYAGRLVDAARTLSFAAVGMGSSDLEKRIRAILATRINRSPVGVRQAACAGLVAVLLLAPLAFLRAQQPEADAADTHPPSLLYKVEPEYTEEARAAMISGAMRLVVEIGTEGKATRVDVIDSLGYGLDENAVAAVRQWRFEPAKKDGKPLAAEATIQINWRLK